MIERSEGLNLIPIPTGQNVLVSVVSPLVVVLHLDVDLRVLDVGEGDPEADDGSGVVVGKIETFAHFSPADGDE